MVPPVGFAVAVPVAFPQLASVELVETDMEAPSEIFTPAISIQPFASVTVTWKDPAHKEATELVTPEDGSFHWYVYGEFAPEAATEAEPLQDPQLVFVALVVSVGLEFIVIKFD